MWIETNAGNLVKSESVTHVSIRTDEAGVIGLYVSAAAVPALFAPMVDRDAAMKVRNRLVMELSTDLGTEAKIVTYRDGQVFSELMQA